jgi:hypothetical protein
MRGREGEPFLSVLWRSGNGEGFIFGETVSVGIGKFWLRVG